MITFVKKYSTVEKLAFLLSVLILFYLLGGVLKWTLDYFDMQNERKRQEEGEVIEKNNAEGGENGQQEQERSAAGGGQA